MSDLTYEILSYDSQEDFDNCNFYIEDEGIIDLEDALKVKDTIIANTPERIVKVQSNDREYIEIFDEYGEID